MRPAVNAGYFGRPDALGIPVLRVVLELPSGTIPHSGTRPGDRLEVDDAG